MKYLQIHLYNIEKLKINSILKGVIQIMFISKVKIKNFRNFKDVEVDLGEHMVIVGENKIGKSNFLHALRLVLDPSLPESSRMLQTSDFWDELPRPIKSEEIRIDIELKDFEDDTKLKIILSDFFTTSVIATFTVGFPVNLSILLKFTSLVKITISASFTSSILISFSIPIDPCVSTFISCPLAIAAFFIAAAAM